MVRFKINEFCENIYDELNNYHNHKYNKSLNISKEKYLELITKIQEHISKKRTIINLNSGTTDLEKNIYDLLTEYFEKI